MIKDGAKMSKSRGNVVSPDDMVARYGADSARMYSLFAAPPDRDLDWQDSGVEGVSAFLARVYRFVAQNPVKAGTYSAAYSPSDLGPEGKKIQRKMHQTIRRITEDFKGRWHFNTSVAALMELLNECIGAAHFYLRGRARKGVPRGRSAKVCSDACSRSCHILRMNSGRSLGEQETC